MMAWRRGVLLLAWTSVALASDVPHGWTPGTPAADAAKVLARPPLSDVNLPESITSRISRDTLVVYFSPSCPHCQAVAPELNDLAGRLADRLDILGVASGMAPAEEVAAFEKTYELKWPVVHDVDRSILRAMGARATPSAALVRPDGGVLKLVDLWYPYRLGSAPLVEMRLERDPFRKFTEGAYLGNHVCGACHTQELSSWYLSHHSVAWWTLVKGEHTEDKQCVGCHVTGAGKPGGWRPNARPELVDVGCESCHGPGGPHDGVRDEAAASCAGCHDEKHSIQFSLERAVPLIDHYVANGLTNDQWVERRNALASGTATRELTQFHDGTYVGSKACKSCHEQAYRDWSGSSHAQAMKTLRKEGHTDSVECVSCHATPAVPGARPTTLEGFLRNDAVGCESCHGPGKAHVDAGGGTQNIERLGDDCPVCVIDAICTACHDPKHDPGFDLDVDLGLVRHAKRRKR